MRKQILSYRQKIDSMLENNKEDFDWEKIKQEHLVRISFFQHERLIHLLVTLTFAILEVMALGLVLLACNLFSFILVFLFFILLVPYIGHYYLLENETQKMYVQYDQMEKHLEGK